MTISVDKLTRMYDLEVAAQRRFNAMTSEQKSIYLRAHRGSRMATAEDAPDMTDDFQQETTPAKKGGGGKDIHLDNPNKAPTPTKGGGGEDIDLGKKDGIFTEGVASLASQTRLVKMVRAETAATQIFRSLSKGERAMYRRANPLSRFAK